MSGDSRRMKVDWCQPCFDGGRTTWDHSNGRCLASERSTDVASILAQLRTASVVAGEWAARNEDAAFVIGALTAALDYVEATA